MEKGLRKQLKLGTKPKGLYAALVEEKAKTMNRAEKRATLGKEAWEKCLGFGLQTIQHFAARERKASGNGYNVQTLVDLKARKLLVNS
jgi:hypothetical protein